MEDSKAQQIEALQVAADYSNKLITALNNIIKEYKEDKKEDTEEYQKGIVAGLNWLIQIYNGTKELLIKDGSLINKDKVNIYVNMLNEANSINDDELKAEALEGILAFVIEFKKEAERY